jgi:hypothetical protein
LLSDLVNILDDPHGLGIRVRPWIVRIAILRQWQRSTARNAQALDIRQQEQVIGMHNVGRDGG